MTTGWVDAHKAAGFPVAAGRAAGVSTSAVSARAAKGEQEPPVTEPARAELVAEIRRLHRESNGTDGSPR